MNEKPELGSVSTVMSNMYFPSVHWQVRQLLTHTQREEEKEWEETQARKVRQPRVSTSDSSRDHNKTLWLSQQMASW